MICSGGRLVESPQLAPQPAKLGFEQRLLSPCEETRWRAKCDSFQLRASPGHGGETITQ